MKRNAMTFVLGCALFVGASIAHAGVVYEWVTVKNDMPVGVHMRIELEQSVVSSGSFSLELGSQMNVVPKTGLVSFQYADLSASPGNWLPTDFGYLSIGLSFVKNNFYAAGSIRGSNFGSMVSMSSNHVDQHDRPIFTIHRTNSDNMYPCAFEPNGFCSGATGYLRQVPEPASIALLSFGAVGALVARRRKTK